MYLAIGASKVSVAVLPTGRGRLVALVIAVIEPITFPPRQDALAARAAEVPLGTCLLSHFKLNLTCHMLDYVLMK